MAIESERRFLLKNRSAIGGAYKTKQIIQRYMVTDPACTVRTRKSTTPDSPDWVHELTIKGLKVQGSGPEIERYLTVEEYEQLVLMQEKGTCAIGKVRYYIRIGELTWEIDIMTNANEGLDMVEVEFTTSDMTLKDLPPWVGKEITNDPKYSNAALAKRPYSKWWSTRLKKFWNKLKG